MDALLSWMIAHRFATDLIVSFGVTALVLVMADYKASWDIKRCQRKLRA
jgi:hypothetical protein